MGHIEISTLLEAGFNRMVNRNGPALIGITFVFAALDTVVEFSGIALTVVEQVVSFIVILGLLVVSIDTLRIFTSETDRLRPATFTEDIELAAINVLIGSIAFGLMLGFGVLALVIPGLILLTALWYWPVVVVAEDSDFITGFKESWRLTNGHFFDLFVLGACVVITVGIVFGCFRFLGMLIAFVGTLTGIQVGAFIGNFLAWAVLPAIGAAIGIVFMLATTAATYNRLEAISDHEDRIYREHGRESCRKDL